MFFLPTEKGIMPAVPRNLLDAFENPINISYNDIKISQHYPILLRILICGTNLLIIICNNNNIKILEKYYIIILKHNTRVSIYIKVVT